MWRHGALLPWQDLNMEHMVSLYVVSHSGQLRGHAKMKANAEHIEVRNKRENQGFEMLDQTLPETTFSLAIYCLNNFI